MQKDLISANAAIPYGPMTQPRPSQKPPLTRAILLQILGIIIVSSVAIAAVGHFVLEAPFTILLIVLLGLEFFLAILFIVYRTFVANLS